jgi:uncharacterized membrane protein YjfL (UPF0719 family)
MNEIFDKLLIRFLFTLFICIALIIYKYAHIIFYPRGKKQVLKKFNPLENPADTIHLFSRIIGISLIFSILEFNEYIGIVIGSFHFFIWGSISLAMYLISIYITESIMLSNFTYADEIHKKKNYSYAIITFFNSIALAFIIRTIIRESELSLVLLLILWLFSLVMYSFTTKLYHFVSNFSFNRLLIQKKLGVGLSYSGYLIATTVILTSAFSHEHYDITSYCIQVLLKAILGALILPLFRLGIIYVFKLQQNENLDETTQGEIDPILGQGIYEASIFITSAFLTSIIIGQIHFGTIYPFF